ncbi:copper-binding transcription factor, partial [Coemansia aciculifera]
QVSHFGLGAVFGSGGLTYSANLVMIFLDGKKFACSACIRGHRASSCNHTLRELTEIRPKGRPVTQCERCRQLRKTRKAHVKCLCSELDGASPAVESPT